MNEFMGFLAKYTQKASLPPKLQPISERCVNNKIYTDLSEKTVYVQAIIDYIAGMTDRYCVKVFNELINY